MKQLRYKRKWRAMEVIRRALQENILISWYTTDHEYVVIVRKTCKDYLSISSL